MKNILTYRIYTDFNKFILPDTAYFKNFLIDSIYNTSVPENTDILVIGKPMQDFININEWCYTLSQKSNLNVTYVPLYRDNNESILYNLYYILPKINIKAVIINSQYYKNFASAAVRKNLSLTGNIFFTKHNSCISKKIEAFFYFLQILLTIILICRCYNTKAIIIDTCEFHKGITWMLLRWVFFTKDKNTIFFTNKNIFTTKLNKILKIIKK